jgi:DHA1 family multidrug resistance protein-like MFS transporter
MSIKNFLHNVCSYGWITWFLLFLQFVIYFTFFMFIPFISLYFSKSLGFSISFIGFILAIRMLSQQGLMILGGFVGDKLGYKRISVIGLMIRGTGFAGMGLTTEPILIIVFAILGGLGGALFSPALKATITSHNKPEKQKKVHSLTNIAENTGAILGPMVGLVFNYNQFYILSIMSGGFFYFAAFLLLLLPLSVVHKQKSGSFLDQSKHIIGNKTFIIVTCSMIPFHFLHQQMYLIFPIVASEHTGSSGWIFPYVTLLVISLQWLFTNITHSIQLNKVMAYGYLFMLLSLLPISINSHFFTILIALTGIAIGIISLLPSFNSYVAYTATPNSVGMYFGFSNIAMAVGGALGNFLGGIFYEFFMKINLTGLFWFFLSLLCLVSFLTLHFYTNIKNNNHIIEEHLTK